MDADLENLLAEILARIDEGDAPSRDWLRRRYPECWEELADVLGMQGVLHTALAPDARLGPWRIERELGSGGMGTVYLAQSDAGPVALKVLHPYLAEKQVIRTRFRREFDIVRKIDHPALVPVRDSRVVVHAGLPFHVLVLEYVEGTTLRDRLANEGCLDEAGCVDIARRVAPALAAIHDQGIVHRDLKPANLMLTPEGDVRVLDLGIAWMRDELHRLSRTGDFIGSLLYAAPEQFDPSAPDAGAAADLYALGATLFEAAAGRLPWSGLSVARMILAPVTVRAYAPDVSPAFARLLSELLCPAAERRPADARTLLARLAELPEEAATDRPADAALDTALNEAVTDVLDGKGRVLLVSGGAGSGKSHLARRWRERVEHGDGTLQLLVPDSGAAFREALTGSPRAGAPDALRYGVLRGATRLAARSPTVIVLDDVHDWARDERALVTALATAVAEWPLLLVATTGPAGWTAHLTRLAHVRLLEL